MSTNSSFDTAAYIEPSVVSGWRTSLSSINSSCINDLDSFKKHAAGLEDLWIGYAAEGYNSNFDSFLSVVKNKHEVMKNFDSFLEEVVNTMLNH